MLRKLNPHTQWLTTSLSFQPYSWRTLAVVPIDTGKSGGSVTHGHVPEGSDPDTHTPRIPPTEGGHDSNNPYSGSGVLIMNAKNEDRTASFFAQPGILAGKGLLSCLCSVEIIMRFYSKIDGPRYHCDPVIIPVLFRIHFCCCKHCPIGKGRGGLKYSTARVSWTNSLFALFALQKQRCRRTALIWEIGFKF